MKLNPITRTLLWAAPITWAGLIFVLSGRPGDDIQITLFPHADKVVHFLVFGMLAFLLFEAFFRERQKPIALAVLWAFRLTVIYGAIDEVHQVFVAYRQGAVGDWMADIAGAGAVLLIVRAALRNTVHE